MMIFQLILMWVCIIGGIVLLHMQEIGYAIISFIFASTIAQLILFDILYTKINSLKK